MKINDISKICDIVITKQGITAVLKLSNDDEILTENGFVKLPDLTSYNPKLINTLNIRECLGDYYNDIEYRKTFYKEYGYSKDALDDENYRIRYRAYEFLGWSSKAFHDTNNDIRMLAYDKLGYTDSALNDHETHIRLRAYQSLGWTKNAFSDPSHIIRKEAYDALGYTEESLDDTDYAIVEAAQAYFANQLPVCDDIRYVVYFPKGKGYYVKESNDSYGYVKYKLSENINDAKQYKKISKAINRGAGYHGDDTTLTEEPTGVMRYIVKAIKVNNSISIM